MSDASLNVDASARRAAAITLAEYDRVAAAYRRGTENRDVSQNIEARLDAIEGTPPYAVLDLGCGPGRDLRAFSAPGHEVTGLDGSTELFTLARAASGCPVPRQDSPDSGLPSARLDGIFANAMLSLVPGSEIGRVLADLAAALKPRGVLFSFNPRGRNEEGWVGGRYGCFYDRETRRAIATDAGFNRLYRYYRTSGRPRAEQPWLAAVRRRCEG